MKHKASSTRVALLVPLLLLVEGAGRLLPNEDIILTCLDCHRAHVAGFEARFFLDMERIVLPACEKCHTEIGRGPLDLIN